MESITTAELLELSISITESLDGQLEYWLAITFAIIVASFIAGPKLTKPVKSVLVVLYLLSTAIVSIRFTSAAVNVLIIGDEILSRGVTLTPMVSQTIGLMRITIIIIGTCAAVWFLYSNSGGKEEGET